MGCEIFTRDGERLGTVKEVRDRYFKVDAPMSPDYWLSTECVRGGNTALVGSMVTVTFDKDALDDHKVDVPS
jgi:hypothetical protein